MSVSAATVDSPTSLTVDLAAANSQFPVLLQGCLGLIASPTALAEFGETYGTTPDTTVGAGPFVVTEFTSSAGSTFERNPDYWDAPRPYLDKITIVSAASNMQAAADALQADDATLMKASHILSADRDALLAQGAVGSMNARFYDAAGQPVGHLDRRTVALEWRELRAIPTVIAVAAGEAKAEAIRGAARTGCIDVLVIDERTAATLLGDR